jgi:hypothetical protein
MEKRVWYQFQLAIVKESSDDATKYNGDRTIKGGVSSAGNRKEAGNHQLV